MSSIITQYLCPPLRGCWRKKNGSRCLRGHWHRRSPLCRPPRVHGRCQRTDPPERERCTPHTWVTQRRSQQDEYSICVAMSLYAKGIHSLEVGSLSSALGSRKECTQLTGGGVLVSSPETGGFAGWCVWVFSELVQPLSHGDCQLRGQPPHKDAAGGDKSIKYSRFHFSSEASANTFPQPFPTAAAAEDCLGLGARTSLRGGFSPISRYRNQMPAIAGKLNPSDDFCQTKTRKKGLLALIMFSVIVVRFIL